MTKIQKSKENDSFVTGRDIAMSGLCVWRVTDQCECGKSGKEVEF